MEINKEGSPVLMKSRFQRLLDLAEKDQIVLNTIEFRWSGPEYGWLDLEVLRDGEIVFEASISSVFKPFDELIPWLVNLVKSFRPCSVLSFDIERFYMQICCDCIGSMERDGKYQEVALFTLSLDWDEDLRPAYFILPVRDFIAKLYYSLHDYFKTHKSVFMHEWQDYEYDEHCLERIEADLTSKELEELLPRIGECPEIPQPNLDIPLTEEEAFAILDTITTRDQTISDSGLYRWICDNWVFSPYGEDEAIKDKRAACFLMMSEGEIEYDYEWCFSDDVVVVYPFLERYRVHQSSDSSLEN
ncbi:MAG: hypothetical protein IKU36_07055 [Bacteroidales bacterium]|nr:hypothetical protein [Bacteroidales bacterium]